MGKSTKNQHLREKMRTAAKQSNQTKLDKIQGVPQTESAKATNSEQKKQIVVTEIETASREDELALKVEFTLLPSRTFFSKITSELYFDGQKLNEICISIPQSQLATNDFELTSVLDMKGISSGTHTIKVEMYELWSSGEKLTCASKEVSVEYVPQRREDRLIKVPIVKSVAGFSRAGHSSGIMLERYRLANNYSAPRYDDRFIFLSSLSRLFGKSNANFFFVEDFVGTGNTTLETWNDIRDFVPNPESVYLLLCVAHDEAKRKIEAETPIKVVANKILYDADKVFSSPNTFFATAEKAKLKAYCEKAGSFPEGYGGCQSTVVFYYRAPNNSISILRSNNSNWKGLFPRNL